MNQKKTGLKKLASIKLAIGIFVYLALLCVLATLVPQNQEEVYYTHNYGAAFGKFIFTLQLDHIFSSFWLAIGATLLSLSLLTCTYQRLKWAKQSQKSIPKPRFALDGDTQTKTLPLNLDAEQNPDSEQWKSQITQHFKGYDFTFASDENHTLAGAGTKGKTRYWGSPIMHFGLCVVLAGSLASLLLGEKDFQMLAVGDKTEITAGSKPYVLEINDFTINYYEDGLTPKQYTSQMTAYDAQGVAYPLTTAVNHPAGIFGTKIIQSSYDLHTLLSLKDGAGNQKDLTLQSSDTLKLDAEGHFTLDVRLEKTSAPETSAGANGARLLCMVRHNQEPIAAGTVLQGEEKTLIPGLSIQFQSYTYTTGLQIKYDPGIPIIFIGFIIVVLGMLLRFALPGGTVYVMGQPNQDGVEIKWQKI